METRNWRSWVNYILIAFISSAACAVVISIAVDALGIVPYAILSKIITLNNTLASLIGLILLISVFSVTRQQLGLFWADVMDEKDTRTPSLAPVGAWIVTVASIIGLIGGVISSLRQPRSDGSAPSPSSRQLCFSIDGER